MPRRLWLATLSLVLLTTACSSDRPLGAICKGICPEAAGPTALVPKAAEAAHQQPTDPVAAAMADEDVQTQIRDLMLKKAETVPSGIPERALAELPSSEDGRLRLLALSSGGPFGAFGAGFLNGWSEQTEGDLVRPEAFDVVTGVSAGALLATHAFLGRGGDVVLAELYTTTSTEDVLQQRSLFRTLFSSSFFDTSPLRRTLEGIVTRELLNQVAEATLPDPDNGRPTRLLLVLAVDLDSGLPRVFDLGAIARDQDAPDRVSRYIDALMASSAIPVAFPPVFVDGAMHVDGGARLALFFNRFMQTQRAAIDERNVPAPKLDIIVNSEVTVEQACTENNLIGIGRRSLDVVLNQLTLDSLYRTISEAEQDGFDVRFTTAQGSGCEPPNDPADPFERAFLQCLFAFGKDQGSGEAPFSSGLDAFPKLEISANGKPAACTP